MRILAHQHRSAHAGARGISIGDYAKNNNLQSFPSLKNVIDSEVPK
jgi:hypothetical protein